MNRRLEIWQWKYYPNIDNHNRNFHQRILNSTCFLANQPINQLAIRIISDADLKRKLASIESSDDDENDSDEDDDEKTSKRTKTETDPMKAVSHLTNFLQQSLEQNKIERKEREEENKWRHGKITNIEKELKEMKELIKGKNECVAQSNQPKPSQPKSQHSTPKLTPAQQPPLASTHQPPQSPPSGPPQLPSTEQPPPQPNSPKQPQNPLQQLRQTRKENKETTQQKTKKPKVLVVSDSNGKLLDLHRLKPEAHVIRAERFTTTEATESIPHVEEPSEVTDIIFQVGFNDYRKGTSAEKIQENALEMQLKYFENCPQARQHITAIPPIGHSHNKVNIQLQNLRKFTETNFFTTKTLRDRNTGKVRTGLMNGIHYNNYGIGLVAREMKKSLYSTANRENQQLKSLSHSMKN